MAEKTITHQAGINRRLRLLINPRFQLQYLAHMLGVAAVVCGLLYGANIYFFYRLERLGHSMNLGATHPFFAFVREQRTDMTFVSLVTCVMIVGVIIGYGMYVSNRIAGPIYRMQKHLVEYQRDGHFTPISLRKRDYFPEFAEVINQCFGAKKRASKRA